MQCVRGVEWSGVERRWGRCASSRCKACTLERHRIPSRGNPDGSTFFSFFTLCFLFWWCIIYLLLLLSVLCCLGQSYSHFVLLSLCNCFEGEANFSPTKQTDSRCFIYLIFLRRCLDVKLAHQSGLCVAISAAGGEKGANLSTGSIDVYLVSTRKEYDCNCTGHMEEEMLQNFKSEN